MPTPVTGQIRVGLIGAGLIGQLHSMMIRYVADRTEQSVRVVSVADVSHRGGRAARSEMAGRAALESAEEIIADPSIDAVWICTPTAMHRQDLYCRRARRQAYFLREAARDDRGGSIRDGGRDQGVGRDQPGRPRAAIFAGVQRRSRRCSRSQTSANCSASRCATTRIFRSAVRMRARGATIRR